MHSSNPLRQESSDRISFSSRANFPLTAHFQRQLTGTVKFETEHSAICGTLPNALLKGIEITEFS